ncbi:hypothetical protein B0H14DRAFT_2691124, partial [Mycena olivaceomarginata]
MSHVRRRRLFAPSASTSSSRQRPISSCNTFQGYRLTLDRYAQLPAQDESLARWRASLGIVTVMTVEVGCWAAALLTDAAHLAEMKTPIVIKQGSHSIVSGLRHIQRVRPIGIRGGRGTNDSAMFRLLMRAYSYDRPFGTTVGTPTLTGPIPRETLMSGTSRKRLPEVCLHGEYTL